MTPQEFLVEKLGIGGNPEQVDQVYEINKTLYELVSDHRNVKYVQSLFLDYARIMCEKQKEICAEEAELLEEGFFNRNDDPDYQWVVDRDSILNSPLPNELEDEN